MNKLSVPLSTLLIAALLSTQVQADKNQSESDSVIANDIMISAAQKEMEELEAKWNLEKQKQIAQAKIQHKLYYRQPMNKKEECKLPESNEYMSDKYTLFWDGECRDGYAWGLGREILLAENFHVEEVRFQNSSKVKEDNIIWNLDYNSGASFFGVEKWGEYSMGVNFYDTKKSASSNADAKDEIGLFQRTGYIKSETNEFFGTIMGSIAPNRARTTYENLVYSYIMEINEIKDNGYRIFSSMLNNKTGTPVGIVYARNPQGKEGYFYNGKPVQRAKQIISNMNKILTESIGVSKDSLKFLYRSEEMLDEYLFFACGDELDTNGIDEKLYKEICLWNKDFKERREKYASLSKSKRNIK